MHTFFKDVIVVRRADGIDRIDDLIRVEQGILGLPDELMLGEHRREDSGLSARDLTCPGEHIFQFEQYFPGFVVQHLLRGFGGDASFRFHALDMPFKIHVQFVDAGLLFALVDRF